MKTEGDKKLDKFLVAVARDFFIMAPQKIGGKSSVAEVKSISDIDWSGQMTSNSWKSIFLPATEVIFKIKDKKLSEVKSKNSAIACVGMNILDLKALTLFDLVLASDVYYQKRRNNILIIGFSPDWPNDYKKFKVFSHNWEENILEHVVFDVFLAKIKGGQLRVYSGSPKGQKILDNYGLKDYKNIEFSGPIQEKGQDKKMLSLKDRIVKSRNKPIWDKLDKICLACGKCSIVCPTCFCFDLEDKIDPEQAGRVKKWGNCFYNDFSKVAGGHRELDTVKKKIYFWYTHKFLRIPEEYGIPGCVSCGRCSKVCPVKIDINKNIQVILK
ncbi:MAG: 4Fe-4S dicluster domain-containing protein [Patescibacteria group bacterium]